MTFVIRVYERSHLRNVVITAESLEAACKRARLYFELPQHHNVWIQQIGENDIYVFPTPEE